MAVQRRADEFPALELANTAWAFAAAGESEEKLLQALARVTVIRVDSFEA